VALSSTFEASLALACRRVSHPVASRALTTLIAISVTSTSAATAYQR